jgi:HIV-1 Vpr-binding protein
LIYQHLISKGLNETANTLHRETNLDSSAIMKAATTYQPFTYRNPVNVTVSKKNQNL